MKFLDTVIRISILVLMFLFSRCEGEKKVTSPEVEDSTLVSNQFDYTPGSISVELDPISMKKNKEEYRIVFNRDGKNWPIIFFTDNMDDYAEDDKIEVMDDLLKLKGDLRVSSEKVACRSATLSFRHSADSEIVSIQLEALYRINEVVFPDFFREYSPYPVLIDKKTKQEFSFEGYGIDQAYLEYEAFLRLIRKNGYDKIKEERLEPLTIESNVKWLHGI